MKEYSREILEYSDGQKRFYENMDEQLKRNPNYQPLDDYMDKIGKNFMNDRLIPENDIDTSKYVL